MSMVALMMNFGELMKDVVAFVMKDVGRQSLYVTYLYNF